MRLRQSFIKQFASCPLKAKFDAIDLKPGLVSAKMSFGTCIHYALEIYNTTNGDVAQATNVWKDVWFNPDKLGCRPDYYHPRSLSHEGYMKRGIKILKEYHERQAWDSREVIGVEHQFLVPFGEHELTGTVDLLELKRGRKDNVLRITDYKSTSKQPTVIELRQDIQYTAYWYASLQPEFWLGNGSDFPPMENGEKLWERLRNAPRRAIMYGLWFNKEFDAGERNDRDFLRLHRVADMMQRAIDHDVFVPNISGESCTDCPYQDPCGLPFPEDLEALADAA